MRLITPEVREHSRAGSNVDWKSPGKELISRVGQLAADRVISRLKTSYHMARKLEKLLDASGSLVGVWGCYVENGKVDVGGYDPEKAVAIFVYFPVERQFSDREVMELPTLKGYYNPKPFSDKMRSTLVWRGIS